MNITFFREKTLYTAKAQSEYVKFFTKDARFFGNAGVDKRLRRLPSKQKKWVRFPPPAFLFERKPSHGLETIYSSSLKKTESSIQTDALNKAHLVKW